MDILEGKDDYNFSYDNAQYILEDVKNKFITEKYLVENFLFLEDINDSGIISRPISKIIRTPTRKDLRYDCFIGIKCLLENRDNNGFVRDKDLVYCVKHIAHEAQHLYRNLITYQEPLSGYYLDMARMEALGGYFQGYKKETYPYHPAEIDAEIQGLINTVTYFDQIKNNNGIPIIDARKCLFEKYCELPTNRIWKNGTNTNFSDMINTLKNMQSIYKTQDRGFPLSKNSMHDSEIQHRLDKYQSWQNVLYESNKLGTQYDEKLFAMLIDINKLWIQTHEGIKKEATRVTKIYPRQLPTTFEETFIEGLNLIQKIKTHDNEML